MPADYKYEHISLGRMKALERANDELFSLYKEMAASGMIATTVMERLKVIRELVSRAALKSFDVELLEKIFGKDLGEEPEKGSKQVI